MTASFSDIVGKNLKAAADDVHAKRTQELSAFSILLASLAFLFAQCDVAACRKDQEP